jgi:hypothetical protein
MWKRVSLIANRPVYLIKSEHSFSVMKMEGKRTAESVKSVSVSFFPQQNVCRMLLAQVVRLL